MVRKRSLLKTPSYDFLKKLLISYCSGEFTTNFFFFLICSFITFKCARSLIFSENIKTLLQDYIK